MGIFSTTSPFDAHVERATSEKNTNDDWSLIMDVCDRVKESPTGPKDCLRSITKRLSNDYPRVVLQTITLLDACINNCGRKFLLEVAGREFEQELQKLITSSRTHPKVSQRLRESLKKWIDGEFKGDKELSLIPALYAKLVKEGFEFEFSSDSVNVPKKTVKYSTDPNVVNNAQEEEDIAKAIQLSLQESGSSSYKSSVTGSVPRSAPTGLYSNASAVLASEASAAAPAPEKESLKVRALYDFEAAEDNELTFKAGEIIIILDNSDANWWKGTNHRGEGLFPANFVTTNLEGDISYEGESHSNKRVSFSECVEVTEVEDTPSESTVEATGEIDEDKIDQLLHLLHEADPTGERNDDPSLPVLEEQVNAMAPSIDAELECIDKKHAQLARISTDLVDALGLYHQLMREMPSPMPYYSPYSKMMPNSGQNVMPPQYLPQNMQQPQMYPPSQYPPYIGPPVSGIPPQYLAHHMGASGGHPQQVHPGSPSHRQGPTPMAQVPFQHMPNHGEGSMPDYSHYNQASGAPDIVGMPSTSENMVPPSSQPSVTSQQPPMSIPPHGYPQAMSIQGHHMTLQNSQGNGLPQGAIMIPPTSMSLHSLPTQQGSSQGLPPTSMALPPQGPPTSMPPSLQGPPTSMPFYPQPPMHSMQQPLL